MKINRINTITPNLWTLLQIRMLFDKVKEGEKNSIWSISVYNDISINYFSLLKYKITFLKFLIIIIMMIPITIFNRIVDLFGQGDSYTIVLEKKHE